MKRQRRTFSKEFKRDAAVMVLDKGYSISQAAGALDIHQSTLKNWIQKLEKERGNVPLESKALIAEQQRGKKLEFRVNRLESEKAILLKVIALMSNAFEHSC